MSTAQKNEKTNTYIKDRYSYGNAVLSFSYLVMGVTETFPTDIFIRKYMYTRNVKKKGKHWSQVQHQK